MVVHTKKDIVLGWSCIYFFIRNWYIFGWDKRSTVL